MLRNALEPWHLLILGLVIIVVFGSKKLPDTARSLGRSLRILKSETKAMKEDGTVGSASSESGQEPPAGPSKAGAAASVGRTPSADAPPDGPRG